MNVPATAILPQTGRSLSICMPLTHLRAGRSTIHHMAIIASPDEVRSVILERAEEGEPLEVIEQELIEPVALSEDDKSGLWLYAWSTH